MLTQQQEQLNRDGLNALREWTASHTTLPRDDWRLVEALGAVLLSGAVGCQGQWGEYSKIVVSAIIAVYNIGVARGRNSR